MADYSKKALTREEALKLKALGESYDVTPMSIKEAIIAGASSKDGEDFLVQALTNDERLDYYRNGNSDDDGSSSGDDGGYSEAHVTFVISDQLIELMTENNIDSVPFDVYGPFVTYYSDEEEQVSDEEEQVSDEEEQVSDEEEPVISNGYLEVKKRLTFGLENTPINVTAVYPTGGVCQILLGHPPSNDNVFFFTPESSGNIVIKYDGYTGVGINGDCILIVDFGESPK